MAKLTMVRGLPGSGKTTWAKSVCANDSLTWLRVNKDEIRIKLGMSRKSYRREQEAQVVDERDRQISLALGLGISVISDDTNFGRKHEPRLRALAAKHGADFEIKDFTGVPVEVCIERDSKREGDARVGADVIWGMAEAHLGLKRPQPLVYDPSVGLPIGVICDLDGTLAIHKGRSPYDFQRCGEDLVNRPIYDLLWCLFSCGRSIIYLSGREDSCRDLTQAWLNTHKCPAGPLYMRAAGDSRRDNIVKRELFDAHVRGAYNIHLVLDDRDQVVRLWRELGLTCLQVNYGDF